MTVDSVAVLLGVFFTVGCVTIYEFRRHARAMTQLLTLAVVCLGMFVGLVALAGKPEADAQRRSTPSKAQSAARLPEFQPFPPL